MSEAAFPIDENHRHLWPRRFPFEFSGGQRTRLALAQLLATRPDVLVLDEPSTGLDTVSRHLLIEALVAVRDRGVAVLLVTHDEHIAGELGDVVHRVGDGRLLRGTSGSITRPVTAPHVSCGEKQTHTAPPEVGVLVADRLELRMSRTQVLSDASFAVRRGEMVGLVGASGSGKTSLLRAIAGLTPVAGGSVALDGVSLPRLSRRSRATMADVQYVCQEVRASFEPDRPVLGQVARTAVRLRGVAPEAARAEAVQILERLDLSIEQARRHPDGLSGGQLRRIALARALIAHPRVLLCDEVTTGLEKPLAGLIIDTLDARCRDFGTTVILAGHDLRAMVDRVHRLIVLDRGEITDDLPVGDWARASPALLRLLAADGIVEGAGE
ncbi:Glutathione import ATP-binding protein GsiA [Gordonia insulae]|uniref:Glutathione import ATP-binding protein GsiA n=1 Tax=Gordonia insulae TaxID=2420509 RepID=A0A3G8JT67_9ACTN|nr:Glutathione import ATP-binding protein GsiA [Gordonia insulae]